MKPSSASIDCPTAVKCREIDDDEVIVVDNPEAFQAMVRHFEQVQEHNRRVMSKMTSFELYALKRRLRLGRRARSIPRMLAIVKPRRTVIVKPRERRDGSRRNSTRGSTGDDAGGSEPPAAPDPQQVAGVSR